MTAQIFHSLGFFWARETGMYDLDDHNIVPRFGRNDTIHNDLDNWRTWAARETQLRALLGHYVLDGQISQYTGGPTCQKHTTNVLHLPASDEVFAAPTFEQWASKARPDRPHHVPLWQFFSSMFSAHVHIKHLGTSLSALGASVVLEGIRSLIADAHAAPGAVVGSPSSSDISFALSRFYKLVISSTLMTAAEKLQIKLRWHALVIDAALDYNRFCHNLCHKFKVRQGMFRGRREDKDFDLEKWASSASGRRSLLSATAIHDALNSLPFGNTQTIHLAASVFTGATVYCGMLLSGIRTISVPQVCDWESILMLGDNCDTLFDAGTDDGFRRFLGGATVPQGVLKNLRYDMSLFTMSLGNIANIWGVSIEMHQVLQKLLLAANSMDT